MWCSTFRQLPVLQCFNYRRTDSKSQFPTRHHAKSQSMLFTLLPAGSATATPAEIDFSRRAFAPCPLCSRLRFAVDAAVHALFAVGQYEFLRQLLLNGGNAARIFALQHAAYALGQIKLALFLQFPAAYYVHGYAWVNIAYQVPIKLHFAVDFYNVLAAQLPAGDVF